MATYTHLIGRRVRSSGDAHNAPREGIITDIKADRWGTDAVILWDEEEAIGWDRDGSAVTMSMPVSTVAAHTIATTDARPSRFALIA